jgi:V/A-type H+-transporting ATPase subunit C
MNTAGSFSDEVYTGARSFSLKGSLLTKPVLETLAESKSLEELINRLKGTPYNAVVSKLQPSYSAHSIELALRGRLADIHYGLMRTARSYELLQLYYLKYIAWNMKLALKAKALGKGYDETMTFIDLHSEELIGRRELIAKVLSAKDLQEASVLLSGTEFGKDVAKAVTLYQTQGDVRVFDLYLDHSLYSKIAAMSNLQGGLAYSPIATDVASVKDMVAADVDSYNVLSLLRAKLWGVSISDAKGLIVLPPFSIQVARLTKILNTEVVADAVKLLEGTPYKLSLQVGANDEETITVLESEFEDASRKAANRAFLWHDFSLGTALALVKLLEWEVKNLSAISFGVEAGVPAKNVLAALKL